MAVSADQVAGYRSTLAGVRSLVLADLQAWWVTAPKQPADVAKAAAAEFLEGLLARYGDVAAMVAADFFDEARASSTAAGAHRAVLAGPPPAGEVAARVGWSAAPLYGADVDDAAALGRLSQTAEQFVLGYARRTMADTARRDPARVGIARVPTGRETCAFCLMLAARGPVYEKVNDPFHGFCDCAQVPVWDGDDLPGGYDLDDLQARYERARDAADSGSTKAILASLRAQEGSH